MCRFGIIKRSVRRKFNAFLLTAFRPGIDCDQYDPDNFRAAPII